MSLLGSLFYAPEVVVFRFQSLTCGGEGFGPLRSLHQEYRPPEVQCIKRQTDCPT